MNNRKSVALLVGVTSYRDTSLNPLPSAERDVQKLSKALGKHFNDDVNFEVTECIVDENSTWSASDMLNDVDRLLSSCNHFLFYFSGHGVINNFGLQLATPEKEEPNDSGVYFDVLLHRFNKSDTAEVTIILDCCFSGAAGDSSISSARESLKLTHLREGITILASSGRTEISEAFREGLSVFTEKLVERLDEQFYDSIDIFDLYKSTSQELDGTGQIPVLRTFGSKYSPIRASSNQIP